MSYPTENTSTNQPHGLPPWRALFPFGPNTLSVTGGRMHFVDEGSGNSEQTLLFVHGNPTWSFHWRRFIAALRKNYRCVAPDHLGCGLSDLQPRPLRLADHIANLSELVAQLDLRRITLMAQDWGGAIGFGAALASADRFERIVLFNTGAFPPWYIPWRIRVCRWSVIGQLAVQGGGAFSRAALRMTLARRDKLDPAVAAGYLAPYDSWQRRAAVYQFVRDIPLSPRHTTWQTLAEIETGLSKLAHLPKLLVWGMRDWCFTPECLTRFREHWSDAEVHELADVGHWVVEDAPEQSLALVEEFLARTDSPRPTVEAQP